MAFTNTRSAWTTGWSPLLRAAQRGLTPRPPLLNGSLPMTSRSVRPALVVAVLGATLLTGCAGKSTSSSSDASSSSQPSSLPPSPQAAGPPAPIPSPTPPTPAVDQTIRITYAGGKVVGGPQLVKVKQNSTV